MPHIKDSSPNLFIQGTGSNGVWNVPYTILFSVVILFLFSIAQTLGMLFSIPNFSEVIEGIMNGDVSQLESLSQDGEAVWPAALYGGVFGSLFVWVFVKLKKGHNLVDYLDLRLPRLVDLLKWFGIMFVLLVGFELISDSIDTFDSDFMEDVMSSIKSPYMAILSIGVAGPIFEELLFRGFLFKGIERSKLGPHLAVWITALLFAIIHMQYNVYIMFLMIIPMALVLGYSKLYTRSILVPMILHIFNNVITTVMSLSDAGTL